MEIDICNQVFGNLYNNKVIIRHGTIFFCEFLDCGFENNILTIKLKVLEPVVKLKLRYQNLYEKLKNKEYLEFNFRFDRNKYIGMEKQEIWGIYSSHIWANYDLVREIYKLKEQGKEEEIYDKL